MGKAHHDERCRLYTIFIGMMDSIRKRLFQVLIFTYRGAIILIDRLDPDGYRQTAGRRHLLHKIVVAELVDGHHGDETPLFSAE